MSPLRAISPLGTVVLPVEDVLPILEADLLVERDAHSAKRFRTMCERYASVIERERRRLGPDADITGPDRGAADT